MFRFEVAFACCLAVAAPATAQVTRISVSTAGVEANGPSREPSIAAGRRSP